MSDPAPSFYDAVWALVARIPPGQVTTYGRVAAMLGSPRAARAVGYALFNLREGVTVPWHRVVNAKGEISLNGRAGRPGLQRRLLEDEGIVFDAQGRLSLQTHLWAGGLFEETYRSR